MQPYKKTTNGDTMNSIIDSIGKAQMRFTKDRATEEVLIKDWERGVKKKEELTDHGTNLLKVRAIFQQASETTQKQLEFHISGLVSTALAAIWDDPYEFLLEFVQRRGKTEADLWVVREDSKIKPLEASGGGVVDVLSLALRMAFWSLTKTTRALLILDEPFKHLSGDLQAKASDMLKVLSEKLGLQIIMISHISELVSGADKQIEVVHTKKGSTIK